MNEPVEEEPLAFEEAVSAVTEAVEPASQSSSLYSGDSSSMEKGHSICNSKDVLSLLP